MSGHLNRSVDFPIRKRSKCVQVFEKRFMNQINMLPLLCLAYKAMKMAMNLHVHVFYCFKHILQ